MGGVACKKICTCPGRPKIRSTDVETEGDRDTQQSRAVIASEEEWSRPRSRSPVSEKVWNIKKLNVGWVVIKEVGLSRNRCNFHIYNNTLLWARYYLNPQRNPIDPGVNEPLQFPPIFDDITRIRLQSHFHLLFEIRDINNLKNFRDIFWPH